MTDEQWLWLFANEALDGDEKFDSLCPTCQHDVSSPKCIRCGKPLRGKQKADFINPNFDPERFDRLNGTSTEAQQHGDEDEVDYDLLDRIMREQQGTAKEE